MPIRPIVLFVNNYFMVVDLMKDFTINLSSDHGLNSFLFLLKGANSIKAIFIKIQIIKPILFLCLYFC